MPGPGGLIPRALLARPDPARDRRRKLRRPRRGPRRIHPRLYNVLEIERDFSAIRIHTRRQQPQDSDWDGWPEWPDPKGGDGEVPYYTIGARNVRVFGSVARGEATPDSDVDLVVDFDAGRSLLDHGALIMDLQDTLGCRVDVVSAKGLRERFRDRVFADAVPL